METKDLFMILKLQFPRRALLITHSLQLD